MKEDLISEKVVRLTGVPSLVKDNSRQPVPLGAFYFAEIEGERKNYLVRKAGDVVSRRVMWFRDNDKPEESYLREEITEDQLRQEFVALRIYRELGLEVPSVQLKTIEGKTVLVVEDLGSIRRIDLSSATLNDAQRAQVKGYYIASHLLNNPYFVYSLSARNDGQLVLPDALPQSKNHEPTIFFSPANPLLRNYIDVKKYEKAFGLNIDPKGKIEQDFRQKIEALSSQRIVEIVLEAGLPIDETRLLLEKLLAGKETTLRILTPQNLEEALNNTPEWDKLDEILEQSEGNRPFRDLTERAQRAAETIEEVRKNIKLITGKSHEEHRLGVDFNISPKELGKKLMGLRFAAVETELKEGARELLKIKQFLESKRKALPGLIFKLRGYPEVERALIDQTRTLESRFRQYTNGIVEQIWKGLSRALEGESVHDLVNYLSPTKKQLESIAELCRVVSEDEIKASVSTQNYDLLVNILLLRVKRRRIDFKLACEERNHVLVSHLSIPSLVEASLREGFLQSSLKQSQDGKTPAVNSPAGEQEILPQLVFAIDGAALGYGGLDKRAVQIERNYGKVVSFSSMTDTVEIARSVGFVIPYSLVVGGRNFVEHPCSGRGIRKELHVFDPRHSDQKKVGIQISIDHMFLFVPEQDRGKWKNFLAKPKELGGAGKSQDWIQSHLRSYPRYVDLDIYLRYFVDRESLGITLGPPGIFVTDKEEMTIHRGNKKQKLFTWVSQSV